jgi:tight adherence protein C
MTIALVSIVLVAVVLVLIGLRGPRAQDTIQDRLMEYSGREEAVTLEELELSQPFRDRVLIPLLNGVARFVGRFTPQQSLEKTRHRLTLAGNPNNWSASQFWGMRVVATVALGAMFFLLLSISSQPFGKRLLMAGGAAAIGFVYPQMWLGSKIRTRQSAMLRALPDALDLLTICVEAGLGFDAAMQKVNEKWDDPLALEFGRVIREIQLGKARRDALGVSIAKVLRIQSEQMRRKRRQRAEEKAHQAPIKMLFPMVFLIFPSIYIVLLGPAVLTVMESGFGNLAGG